MWWFLIRLVNVVSDSSVAMECETKVNIEGPPVKAVREAVRRRLTPQSALFKAVRECEQTATWLGPPKDPPSEVDEMEVEDVKLGLEFDANHAWNPKARHDQRDGKRPHKGK